MRGANEIEPFCRSELARDPLDQAVQLTLNVPISTLTELPVTHAS